MRCLECGSQAVTERPERTAQGYRRFRCRTCGKQFNERSGGVLNRTQYPSDVIALVVLWRLRYKLSLRDLPEMFAVRGRGARIRGGGAMTPAPFWLMRCGWTPGVPAPACS
jgi:putative transposase